MESSRLDCCAATVIFHDMYELARILRTLAFLWLPVLFEQPLFACMTGY